MSIGRIGVTGLVCLAMASAGWPLPPARAEEQASASRKSYEACQARDETAFREAVERVTVRSLEASIKGLDYQPIIADAWRRGDIDDILAKRVDAVLQELTKETSWSELITSLASKETQEKLAKAAAERVYGSEAMRKAMERLAGDVGAELGKRLELAGADADEANLRCFEIFLDGRYGASFARATTEDARVKFTVDQTKSTAPVSGGSVLIESREGIAGLVAIIMRRQLGNLAQRVSQRLVGAVLGRVVSVVAGGIGVVLIAKDIWELRNGVLPIIASEMKAPSTRDKVQAELAKSVATEIDAHVHDIAKRTADRVMDLWLDARRAHGKVLELAERNADFKRFFDNVDAKSYGRLDEIVALELASGGGEAKLLARAADGSLAEAVGKWPQPVMDIAREQRSLEAGFKWRALAGDALMAKVKEWELYRHADPDQLTRASLARIIGLDDRVAAVRLAAIKRQAIEPLLEASDADLKRLARGLDEGELGSLASYLGALEPKAGKDLLVKVAEVPARMQGIAAHSVRDAIVASRNQMAALDMMLKANSVFNVNEFVSDLGLARSGEVSPRLILARYPYGLAGLGVLGLFVVMLLWRALFGRRQRIRPTAGA
ncbi:MAG: hypothetical protein JSS20_08450 [Proteobacteria bacterium]|nr:hypothetical protein [Pseudomonadota bacterium]